MTLYIVLTGNNCATVVFTTAAATTIPVFAVKAAAHGEK